ncbi:hypothetical protein ACFE04_029503 [Oxalis oulophora]
MNTTNVEASFPVVEPSSLAKLCYHSKKRKDMAKGKTNKSSKASHRKVARHAAPTSNTIEFTPSIESNIESPLGSEEEYKEPLSKRHAHMRKTTTKWLKRITPALSTPPVSTSQQGPTFIDIITITGGEAEESLHETLEGSEEEDDNGVRTINDAVSEEYMPNLAYHEMAATQVDEAEKQGIINSPAQGNVSLKQNPIVFMNGCGNIKVMKKIQSKIIVWKDKICTPEAQFPPIINAPYSTANLNIQSTES